MEQSHAALLEPRVGRATGEHVNPHPGGILRVLQGRLDGTDHGLPMAVCGVRLDVNNQIGAVAKMADLPLQQRENRG